MDHNEALLHYHEAHAALWRLDQDWPEEYESAEQAVDEFIREAPDDDSRAAAVRDLRRLVNDFTDDTELGEISYLLGLNYLPDEGLRSFLLTTAERIEASLPPSA